MLFMLLLFFDLFFSLPGSSDAPGPWDFSSCRLALCGESDDCEFLHLFPGCLNSSKYRKLEVCVKRKGLVHCLYLEGGVVLFGELVYEP